MTGPTDFYIVPPALVADVDLTGSRLGPTPEALAAVTLSSERYPKDRIAGAIKMRNLEHRTAGNWRVFWYSYASESWPELCYRDVAFDGARFRHGRTQFVAT